MCEAGEAMHSSAPPPVTIISQYIVFLMFFHALKHVNRENVTASLAAFKAKQAILNFDFFCPVTILSVLGEKIHWMITPAEKSYC